MQYVEITIVGVAMMIHKLPLDPEEVWQNPDLLMPTDES